MELKDKIDIGYKIIRARLFNNKVPLFVSWSITNRCNLTCKYCSRWKTVTEELKTSKVFSMIDELKGLGTKMISFTGGEPLMREDIGAIIDYAFKKGLYVNMNTNGTLFSERINELNNLSSVKFSLDGQKAVNDFMKKEGAFDKVLEAIKLTKDRGISASIVTVLSKYNLNSIDYLTTLAKDLGVGILFQPLTLALLFSKTVNTHIPDVQEYRDTIDRLIEYKKKNYLILNTRRELLYLRNWPKDKQIVCYGRNISCRIETDAYLYHCGRRQDKDSALNCLAVGIKKAFDNLSYVSCSHCWCALRLKANYVASLDPQAIFSTIRDLK